MYKVKVDDGFCEWEFELEGSSEYSIQNIVDAITNNTTLWVKSAQQGVQRTADTLPQPTPDNQTTIERQRDTNSRRR